jgi:CheY-like chemotaxis protein
MFTQKTDMPGKPGTPPPVPKKVLVVDDNEVIVKTVTLKLKGAGFQVVVALDGSEAVAMVRKEKPDLILLDISFPPDVGGVPWDGFRIMEWLRRVDESKKIPIIIITGGAGEKDKEKAIANGAVGFLYKPLDHDELLKMVRATLAAPANA